MPDQSWAHDDLQADLARSRLGVGEVTCQKLSLGFWGGSGEMDVFSLRLSRTQPRPTCYEVKVTRSDFLADVRQGKHRRYEPWVERCYFATPAGMVKRDEIPDGWGLITRGPNGWNGSKAPAPGRIDDRDWRGLMLAVLLNQNPGPWAEPTRAQKAQAAEVASYRVTDWRNRLGKRVSEVVRRCRDAEHDLRLEHSRIRAVARELGMEDADQNEISLVWKFVYDHVGMESPWYA